MAGRVVPALALVALLGLAALTPAPAAGEPHAEATHVHITGFAFSPETVSILAGESVTWHNHDGAPHDATADDATWLTPTLLLDETATLPFAAAKTHPYYCSLHNTMLGTLVVNQPGALPDLVVAGLDADAEVPGVAYVLTVHVRNLGLSEAPANRVDLAYRHQGEEHALGAAHVPLLGPGASAQVAVDWLAPGKVGDFPVVARVDPLDLIPETVEANNAAEATASLVLAGAPPVDLLDPL